MDLLDSDVDLKQGMMTIRQTKFAKSRQLPLHSTTIAALQSYRRLRNRHIVMTPETPFFVGSRGKQLGQRLQINNVDLIFAGLRKQLGWVNRGAHHAPRIHDLRHTFAVRRVMLWHEHGTDVDMTPELILAFLDHLERVRHNSVRSRNARWAALRAFLRFAARHDLASLIGVTLADVVLDGAPCVHLHGKGRKQRAIPLWKSTAQHIRAWLRANPALGANSALLPNRDGAAMTRFNVTRRLQWAVQSASMRMASLANKTISPHTIRHTTAMHLLQSGVDISVIALWLGHERPTTTHM